MFKPYRRWIPLLLLAFLVLNACNLPSLVGQGADPTDPNQNGASAAYTQAALTVMAQLTQVAPPVTSTPGGVLPPIQPSPTTGLLPSATPFPTNSAQPSLTPMPQTQPTQKPTAVPVACNAATFVKDVTIPDETEVFAGTSFTKTWRIKNVGTCTWDDDYTVVYVDGDEMSGDTIRLDETVAPGETVDISVDMVAPSKPGEYTGYWMLRDGSGRFGLGAKADKPFFVSIRVEELDEDTALDFVASYCAARWSSDAGTLDCPGDEGDEDGFVIRLEDPDLESRRENEPALWTQPEDDNNGWIVGVYPKIEVESGDHFMADIGCLDGNEDCDVVFQFGYLNADDDFQIMAEWHEVADGDITRADVDLTDLDGEDLQFVLAVEANGDPDEDAAFWLQPHIRRE